MRKQFRMEGKEEDRKRKRIDARASADNLLEAILRLIVREELTAEELLSITCEERRDLAVVREEYANVKANKKSRNGVSEIVEQIVEEPEEGRDSSEIFLELGKMFNRLETKFEQQIETMRSKQAAENAALRSADETLREQVTSVINLPPPKPIRPPVKPVAVD